MLTSIALIVSSLTSCACIIVTVRQVQLAKDWRDNYYMMQADRDRLIKISSDQTLRITNAEFTLKKVRELVITDDPKSDGEA